MCTYSCLQNVLSSIGSKSLAEEVGTIVHHCDEKRVNEKEKKKKAEKGRKKESKKNEQRMEQGKKKLGE